MRIKRFIIFNFLKIARSFRNILSESERAYQTLFTPGYENFRWRVGKWKAWMVFEHARKSVPAYKEFLKEHQFKKLKMRGWEPDLTMIPSTDKESYIKKYSIESRCVYGSIPRAGVMIDESSGTSGSPNNWVRGQQERLAVKKALQIALHHIVGDKQVFILNAFALGPWATGMNVSMSFVDVAVLKSVGPDVKKIENTLNAFGPKYQYVIMGYPPFLKSLIDTAAVDWAKYNIILVFGGEGMSEGMRQYLGRVFKKVYGSYGASDLEINIAAENDFTIALRQLILKNKNIEQKLVRVQSKVPPMIFQYNPLDYYIETNEQGELMVTLCRDSNVSPKVRYNIHDIGHVIRFPELKKVLSEFNMKVEDVGPALSDLPLLFHYGRSDMAAAFFGCKITPLDIEEIVYNMPELASEINSFSLITYEDGKVNKKLVLAIEFSKGKQIPPAEKTQQLTHDIFEKLKTVNQDYREVSHMIPSGSEPQLEIHSFGEGPFAINDIRLKNHYIQKR